MNGNLLGWEGGLINEFRRLQEELDQWFGTGGWPNSIRAVSRGTYPPLNVGANAEQVEVYLFAAGIDPKRLDISIQRNLLTIAGERQLMSEEGANYYRRERFEGEFRRVVTLPEDVDPEQVDASYRNGVLHIVVKRRESAKPKKITVQ